MRIAVPREIKSGEKRVALVPDIISKLIKAGLEVVIESGAGVAAQYSDKQFSDAGAQVKSTDVIDGPKSVVWRQAFHRRTTIQALLYHLTRGDLKGNK